MIDVAPNTVVPAPQHVTNATLWTRREFGPASLSMGNNHAALQTQTCAERLQRAKNAHDRLAMGENAQVVSHDGRVVTYVPAQKYELAALIRQLERECGENQQMIGCGRARGFSWRW